MYHLAHLGAVSARFCWLHMCLMVCSLVRSMEVTRCSLGAQLKLRSKWVIRALFRRGVRSGLNNYDLTASSFFPAPSTNASTINGM